MTIKPITPGVSYYVHGWICGFEIDLAVLANDPCDAFRVATDYLIENTKEQDDEFRTSH